MPFATGEIQQEEILASQIGRQFEGFESAFPDDIDTYCVPLGPPSRSLIFEKRSWPEDQQLLLKEFRGLMDIENGETIFLFVEAAEELDPLLLFSFWDLRTQRRIGQISILFRPQFREILFGYFHLPGMKSAGLGRILAERFAALLPDGVRINCVMEEEHTKRILLKWFYDLASQGKVADWRMGSSGRPQPQDGKVICFPAGDCKMIEKVFRREWRSYKTPLFQICKIFQVKWDCLGVGLNETDQFIFQASGVISKTPEWR